MSSLKQEPHSMSTGTHEHQRHRIADIGGTHARFALCHSVTDIQNIDMLASADFPTLEQAIRHYLASQGNPPVRHAVIGIANPVLGDHISMTNFSWEFSIDDRKSTRLNSSH